MKVKEHKITLKEKEIARSSIPAVESASRRFFKNRQQYATIKFSESGNFIRVPKIFVRFMTLVLKEMAQGRTVSLVTSDTEVSTEQAATILNVSRPFVVKLLEAGAIPFKKVGTHRRILLRDVENYHKMMKAKRQQELQKLSGLDQELGLEY
jgi:excisionase family DNA binding protein